MLSFVLVANVEMAGANCSSCECSIAVGFQDKTTVSPMPRRRWSIVYSLRRLPLRPTVRAELEEIVSSVCTQVEEYESEMGVFPVR